MIAAVGMERMPIPGIAGAFIQYPSTLTEANCDVFDAMMLALRAYAKAQALGKEGSSDEERCRAALVGPS